MRTLTDHLTLTIGGDLPVRRLGFGAMRLAPEPDRRAASIATARRAVELGVTFLDTADSGGTSRPSRAGGTTSA